MVLLMVAPASAADQTVTAQPSTQWAPDDVTIDMGDTVTWNNAGGVHNVTFNDGSFTQPSQPDSSDWTEQRTFNEPGIFRYQCGLHGPSMPGVVRVRDATGQVPEPVEVAPGLSVSARDEQTLARVLDRGLRARARCVNGCDITLKLSLAPRTAERFGYPRQRVTIGKLTDELPVDRGVRMDTELNSRAKNRLAGSERPFKVRLDVRAKKDTRETDRLKIKITP